MRVPGPLVPLLDMGVIDEVIRPLMAGKEAQVFLVWSGDEVRVAKVYKEAEHRSFKHRSAYAEGRQVRGSREQRAMSKRSRFGRAEEESAWRSAEVDALFRLHHAGVRVPMPHEFVEGVLVMSLVADPSGEPAPRLADVHLSPREAYDLLGHLLREVVKMLCAGLIHGDLSDFNVLLAWDGPVVIDFPQAIDAAQNNNARKLLLRDVQNLQRFMSRFDRELAAPAFGLEIWDLYERGELRPDSPLTGRAPRKKGRADTRGVIREIRAAAAEEQQRRKALGMAPIREPAVRAPPPSPDRLPDDLDRLLIVED